MIDFSNMTLPDTNDYYKMSDGTFKLKSEVDNDPNTIHVDKNAGYLSGEFSQLGHSLKASAYGLGGVLTGNQGLIDSAKQQQTASNLYQKNYDSVEGVNSIADVAKLGGHYLIQGLPQIALAIGTGGIGGVGAQVANKAMGAVVTDALASKIGTYAGQFAVNSAMSAGQAAANEYTSGNPNDAVKNALINGVVGGIAGTFADQQMLGKFGKAETRLANAGIGAGFNAGIGVAQTGLTNELMGKETTGVELLDSALSGGLIGGLAGSLHKATPEIRTPETSERVIPEIQQNKVENIENKSLENIFSDSEQNATKNVEESQVLPEQNAIKNAEESQVLPEQNATKNAEESQVLPEQNTIKNIEESQVLPEQNTTKNVEESQVLPENKAPDITKEDLISIPYKGNDLISALNKNEYIKSLFLDASKETKKDIAIEFNKNKSKGLSEEDFINRINEKYNPEEKYNPKIEELPKEINEKTKEDALKVDENEIPFSEEGKNKEVIDKQEALKDNVQYKDLTREEKIAYNKENIPLNEKEKGEVNSVKSQIDSISKRLNVNIEVLHQNHSPFRFEAGKKNGWHDPVANKIYLVAGENFVKDKIRLLKHELVHNGLYKMLRGVDFDKYKQEMNRLYQNKEVAVLADQLSKDFGYPKEKAVEEALARFSENGTLDNLPMKTRIYDFFKKILNSVLGSKEYVSNKEIKDFLSKVDEYNYEPIKSTKHITDNIVTYREPEIHFDEMKPEDIDKDLKGKEEDLQKILNTAKGIGRDVANKTVSEQKYIRNASKTFDEYISLINEKTKDFKNIKNAKDGLNSVVDVLKSGREFGETYESTKKYTRLYDTRQSIQHAINNDHATSYERTKIQSKGLSNTDIKAVNETIYHFAYDFASKNKDGSDKFGNYRPSDEEVKKSLIDKGVKDLDKSMQMYKNIREINDKNIALAMFKNLQYPFESLENVLLNSTLVKDTLLPDLKFLQSQVYKGNLQEARTKITDFFNQNKSEFEKILKSEKGAEFKELYKEISESIKEGEDSYNNGYVPKDHEGKYTLNVNFNYKNLSGEDKTHTTSVIASNDMKEINAYYDRLVNSFRDKYEKGEITEEQFNSFTIERSERLENATSTSPDKLLKDLQRKGINYDKSIMDQIYSLSKEANNSLRRNENALGGANNDILQVATKFSNKMSNEISSNFGHTEEVSIFNKIDNNFEKNLFNEYRKRMSGEYLPKEKGVLSKMKTLTSVMQLGFSVPAFLGQAVQFMQAAPAHFSQYTGGTGVLDSVRGMRLAAKYLKDGTTGIAKYDEALKNFKHPLLDASQTKMLFGAESQSSYSSGLMNKIVHYAYKPMESIELLNRYSTFINSHDIYEGAQNGTLNGRRIGEVLDTSKYTDKNDFILKQLVRINGDFSTQNMPVIMQSEVGQFFGMYQMWKIVMAEQFKHLDNKGRVFFLSSIFLTAGLKGIPFEQDLEELIDTFSQITGHKPIAKDALNSFAREFGKMLNSEYAETALKNGMFPSIGQRVGVGEVVPGLKGITELITGEDSNKGLQDFIGPGASIFVGGLNGVNALGRGDISTALRHFAPSAIKNVIIGGNEINNGYSLTADGTKRIAKTDTIDALIRMSGLLSPSQIHQMEKSQMIQELKNNAQHMETYFKREWMQAKMSGDNEKANGIVKDIQTFNQLERKDKSGYAFNLDLSSWNKDFLLAKTSAVQRGNINSNKSIQIANRENLGVDLSRKEI